MPNGQTPHDPYTPDPYGQGPYRPGPVGDRPVPPSTTDDGGGSLRIGRLVLMGLAGGAVLYLLLSLIAGGGDDRVVADATSVPLVRANPEPAKVPPDEPGGLQVPDQDKLIFDRIGGGNTDSSLPEQLLPPPDEPMARPEAPPPPSAPTAEDAPMPTEAERTAPPPAAPAPPTAAVTPIPAPPKPAPAPAPTKPPAAAATPTPAPAPATPAPAPSAGGAAVIQLAALKDEAAAKQAWARIAKANSDLLAGLKPIIVPVQVSGNTLYRLRAGPFASKDAAAQVCAKLKQRNQDCNVVR